MKVPFGGAIRQSMNAQRASVMSNAHAVKALQKIGSPTLRRKKGTIKKAIRTGQSVQDLQINRGIRRLQMGTGAVAAGLVVNHAMAPDRPRGRSSGGTGALNPRSSGGFA
jgi:hypothetical protein